LFALPDVGFDDLWTPEQDLIHAIFKHVWSRRTARGGGGDEVIEIEVIPLSIRTKPAAPTSHSDRQMFCFFLDSIVLKILVMSTR
jgi:hypothetical protein